MQVFYEDEIVVDLDYDFLINGLPQRRMEANFVREIFEEPDIEQPADWSAVYKKIMAHGNVRSGLAVVEQYDTTVQGGSALAPFGGINFDAPNDAAIVRPILDKQYGVITSHGLNPILNRIDPRRGAIWAATEAVANLVSAGGDYKQMVLCGNYVSPVPDPHYMGALDLMVDGVNEFLNTVKRPVVSGKDSLSSTYTNAATGEKIHVPPVIAISTLGRMEDVDKKMTTNFKTTGSTVVLVGKMHSGMGGSTYYDNHDIVGNEVPQVDLSTLPQVFDAVHSGIVSREIKACHDISEGGTAAALAEMCFGGDCGVELDLSLQSRPDFFLFNETAGMFAVEVESPEKAKELFGNVPYMIIGQTIDDKKVIVKNNGSELFTADVDELKSAWHAPMRELFP